MPAQDREAVRTLAVQIGVRQAARKLGLNEDTVCAWSKREAWFTPKAQPPSNAINTQALQARPGDVILDVIKRNEGKTRVSLSRAHRIHAAQAARGKLSPKETLQTAQGASITHGWRNSEERDQAQVAVNIAILGS